MALLGKWFGFGREEIFDQAMRAYDRGDWEAAIERLEACLDDENSETARLAKFYLAESNAQLGNSLLVDGRYRDAAVFLKAALEIEPGYPDVHIALSRAYAGMCDVESRRLEIERALSINSRFVDAVYEKGLFLYENGSPKEGLDLLRGAVESDPTLADERYEQAIEADRSGRHAEAVRLFARSTLKETDAGQIHLRLAANFHRERMFEEAAAEYALAVHSMPKYADVRCRYGQVLLELDQLEPAIAEFKVAIKLNPRYVQAHVYLGVALIRGKQIESARRALRAALELDPNHPVAIRESQRLNPA